MASEIDWSEYSMDSDLPIHELAVSLALERDKQRERSRELVAECDRLRADALEARKAAEGYRNSLYEIIAEEEGELYGTAQEEMPLPWETG